MDVKAEDSEIPFEVEGRGEFPLDMLRRDSARPATPSDQAEADATYENDPSGLLREGGKPRSRRVRLLTSDDGAPLTARWESFGWQVVACEKKPWLISEPREGRPRVHPDGTTASDRNRISLLALEASGGGRKTFRFSAQALASLAAIRARTGEDSDTAVVERLLVEAGGS